jgi:hypothetical protein
MPEWSSFMKGDRVVDEGGGKRYLLRGGKQYTIPMASKPPTKKDLKRLSIMKSLCRQIERAHTKEQMEKCHKLSKRLCRMAGEVEGKYWCYAPQAIAGWEEF